MARIRHLLTASTLVAASLLTSFLATSPAAAQGKAWGKLYARNDSGKLARAYGDFANNGGVYATVGANWDDLRRSDHNPVYVEAEFFFLKGGKWESAGTTQTARTDTSDSGSMSRKLRHDAHAARAVIKVCVDRAHWSDVCSPSAVVSFSY
ncbi:hypothetical protein DWB77_07370 [Streptomyces hundungensis]|uniref:Uncharacterized protein n=1 Tax=Streptomyces hundungensis TaxID=1077946 RepID=A0A387HQR9_9ACTN|nr:hypothetical protein [Streptomyces hundungensis]AYG85153.1 hypothetical protein DWB77_07370 [Streptomyces hundungensis]